MKPQHSSAEATDLLRGRASQLLTRGMIPSSNPSLPVQTRVKPPPATSFGIYGRFACCCWREQDDSGFAAGMRSQCQVKIEILCVTATAQGTNNLPEKLRTEGRDKAEVLNGEFGWLSLYCKTYKLHWKFSRQKGNVSYRGGWSSSWLLDKVQQNILKLFRGQISFSRPSVKM